MIDIVYGMLIMPHEINSHDHKKYAHLLAIQYKDKTYHIGVNRHREAERKNMPYLCRSLNKEQVRELAYTLNEWLNEEDGVTK